MIPVDAEVRSTAILGAFFPLVSVPSARNRGRWRLMP